MDRSLDLRFYSRVPTYSDDAVREAAEARIRRLAKDHTDLIGASIAVEPVAASETPHTFEARVVAYIRPGNIAAREKADTPEGALKGALDALERQVRERRDDLGHRWKRPSQ